MWSPQAAFIMKFSVVFAALIALCSSSVIPEVPKDNSHYVEGVSRYVWLSKDDGELVQVDLHEPVNQQAAETRNGANNQYWLFTRQNPTNQQLLVNGNANSVTNSNYRANRPTNVIVHGWTNNGNSHVNNIVRDAFLAAQDCNVIVVDWSGLAGGSYVNAVSGVPNVGQFLGNFLNWLVSVTGGNWNNFHLIGYSLGAHVIGSAGRTAGGRPARLTGMDPAGPLWQTNSNRLTSNAGQYVEGIHTDGGLQGIFNPVGDADFYPNGGRNVQPGCDGSGCSHARSFEFFASSVRTNHFVGRQCANLNQAQNVQCNGAALNMGNGIVTKRGSGLFGLRTGASWPF
ncbi:unnamed protein product [Diatraea saccharalis]|uniref:Lipase domain-containing protein n=1 Tax=Diatraea saccharalis TaxID=40085 RepID=A0A9N9WME4_9NEOP|nr:unnamed protein product [Diatraea saccharalis]